MIHGIIDRGSTPTQVFILPCAASEVKDATVTYSQKKIPVIRKELHECTVFENNIAITLDQKESLLFRPDCFAEVQLKVLTMGDNVLYSPKYRLQVEDVLD